MYEGNQSSFACEYANSNVSTDITLVLLYFAYTSVTEEDLRLKYFDTSKINNVQIPKDYLNIIYYNLLKEEHQGIKPMAIYNYMIEQKEINEQMRSILIDWLIDVHHKFQFREETLYMTVLIIDRICTIRQI